jgi:ethanolamine permease
VALLVGAVIGFVALILVDALGGAGGVAGAIVLNIAVWGAVIAYILQMTSFVILRRKYRTRAGPTAARGGFPARSSRGSSRGFFINEPARPAIVAIAAVYVVMLLIFALYGRTRLVLSPEGEYAVSGGLHGDPQKEGYGGSVEEEILALDGRDEATQ